MSLHASINYGNGWERLWGWSGFTAPAAPADRAALLNAVPAAPEARAQAKAQAKAQVRPPASPDARWQALLAKEGMQGDWVKLAKFCGVLKLSSNQARRDYLDGPTAWRVGPRQGAKLRRPEDWAPRPGCRGGVAPIYVNKDKLKEVFMKYYV
jgi:hypothetical protein